MAKINKATELNTKGSSTESFQYLHPLGILTIVLDHTAKETVMISFTPCKNINYLETKSIDWFFKDGKCTGYGTGQKGHKWNFKKVAYSL
ncbi:MAG: hypothetical protein ABSG90_07945 [Dehalococcoidia bacterium]|jgi:hypothetical protein